MESLKESKVALFHPDTLQAVRKLYGLDKPGAMSDAIDILEEWIKKQNHFKKKDYDREYLERLIIRSKGSVERSKQRLDKICTSKTLMPVYFSDRNVKEMPHLEVVEDVCLPRPTQDYYRVYLSRNIGQEFENDFFINYYRRLICMLEYGCIQDYGAGLIVIYDFRETNLIAHGRKLNIIDVQQVTSMVIESYGFRIKGIHLLSSSKVVETIVIMFKQVLSGKVASRIHVHSTLESLHKHVEKDILPKEYGGTELSLTELHQRFLNVLGSEEHVEHMKMMNAAGTNEAFRRADIYNEQVLGMPGSFRALRVD